MRGVVLALFFAASVAALAGIGDGFGLGDNGAFAGAAGLGQPKRRSVAAPAPTFDLIAGNTTPNDLSDSLTVNSVSMTLVLACDAQGISGTSWTCRDSGGNVTLTEAGTGSSPTTTINTPFHATDSAERQTTYGATQKRHDAASSTVADLTTDDLVVEYVGKLSGVGNNVIFDKGAAGTDGYRLANNSAATTVAFRLRTASTSTDVVSSGGSAAAWGHFLVFVDRDDATTNGAFGYTNGTAGAGATLSARSATVSNASTFAVGAASASASNAATVASFKIWKCSACMAGGATNPTQWAPIARERASRAWGIAPTIAAGTAAPTALTRATQATVDVVDGSVRHLYLTGNGAPRVARRTYSGGTAVAGYMSEPAVSNIALQSQTLGTTWTAITVGDNVLADAFAGADLSVTGDDIDGNNSTAEHGLRQSVTLTAATHSFSVWARAGSQNFVALRNATVANGAAWFNLATCTSGSCTVGEACASAVGTVQAGVSRAVAERWPVDTTGDGTADVNLCRVSITYTGTAAPHNHDLLCAPSDNTLSYTDADATADCGFWGVRIEAYPTMTSYLATTTAAVARNADDVRFDGASHYTGSPSTMDVQVLCPNFDVASNTMFISAGPSTNDFITNGVAAALDAPRFTGTAGGAIQWDINGSTDIASGILQALRQTVETNNVTGYLNGVSVGTDTSNSVPTATAANIYLGSSVAVAQAGCIIPRARLWSSLVTPAVVP